MLEHQLRQTSSDSAGAELGQGGGEAISPAPVPDNAGARGGRRDGVHGLLFVRPLSQRIELQLPLDRASEGLIWDGNNAFESLLKSLLEPHMKVDPKAQLLASPITLTLMGHQSQEY